MSIVRYGSKTFNAGEVQWVDSIDTEVVRLVPVTRTVRVDLTIQLLGTGIATATEAGNIQAAFTQPGRDLTLSDDSGTVLRHLRSTGSLSGVVCIQGPSMVGAGPSELTTSLTLKATFQAVYAITPGVALVYDWHESLSIEGGGPLYVFQPSVVGRPVRVVAQEATTYKAVQSGGAIGLIGYPSISRPVFGVQNLIGNPRIERSSPRRYGRGLKEYPIAWTYQFESVTPLVGLPGIPP